MRPSLMFLGYVIFATGAFWMVWYTVYHPTIPDMGIALGNGALALIGVIAVMTATDIRKLERRLEALERIGRSPDAYASGEGRGRGR